MGVILDILRYKRQCLVFVFVSMCKKNERAVVAASVAAGDAMHSYSYNTVPLRPNRRGLRRPLKGAGYELLGPGGRAVLGSSADATTRLEAAS